MYQYFLHLKKFISKQEFLWYLFVLNFGNQCIFQLLVFYELTVPKQAKLFIFTTLLQEVSHSCFTERNRCIVKLMTGETLTT